MALPARTPDDWEGTGYVVTHYRQHQHNRWNCLITEITNYTIPTVGDASYETRTTSDEPI